MAESVERRCCARVPLDADVAFRKPREAHYAIKMHDLTAQGCRVACPERLDKGDLVWVQLPSLESQPAWVRWSQKAQSGVEFDHPMHEAVFEMMAGRLTPAEA
jgi:PilZ domain-containing protein